MALGPRFFWPPQSIFFSWDGIDFMWETDYKKPNSTKLSGNSLLGIHGVWVHSWVRITMAPGSRARNRKYAGIILALSVLSVLFFFVILSGDPGKKQRLSVALSFRVPFFFVPPCTGFLSTCTSQA